MKIHQGNLILLLLLEFIIFIITENEITYNNTLNITETLTSVVISK